MKKLLLACVFLIFLVGCTRQNSLPQINNAEDSTEHTSVSLEHTEAKLSFDERFSYVPYLSGNADIKPPENISKRDGLFLLEPHVIKDFVNDAVMEGEEFSYDSNGKGFVFEDNIEIGCGWWCGTNVFTMAEASSALQGDGELDYSAENILVSNRECAWVEGKDDYGIGESITIHKLYAPSAYYHYLFYEQEYFDENEAFDDDEREIPVTYLEGSFQYRELCIVNGYAESETLWKQNSRVKTLRMYINDVPYAYLSLVDTIKPQYFPLYEVSLHFGVAYTFKFEIVDVYEGVLEDTCLTGILFDVSGIDGTH